MGKKVEMLGEKFGKLTVKSVSEYRGKTGKDIYYICDCDCGTQNILILGTAIRRKSKPTLNCRECGVKKTIKHGMRGKRLYKIWDSMKQRCFNANNKGYRNYGGRGITICDEWLGENGFINFMNWAYENGYFTNLTIDRIDNDGNYEPSNCRWADMKTQGNNKSTNKLIEYEGEIKTLTQWSEYLNMDKEVLRQRLLNGWDIERAFNEEVINKEQNKLIEINGKLYTYEEISKEFNININTLRVRYHKGKRDTELISPFRSCQENE